MYWLTWKYALVSPSSPVPWLLLKVRWICTVHIYCKLYMYNHQYTGYYWRYRESIKYTDTVCTLYTITSTLAITEITGNLHSTQTLYTIYTHQYPGYNWRYGKSVQYTDTVHYLYSPVLWLLLYWRFRNLYSPQILYTIYTHQYSGYYWRYRNLYNTQILYTIYTHQYPGYYWRYGKSVQYKDTAHYLYSPVHWLLSEGTVNLYSTHILYTSLHSGYLHWLLLKVQ